MRRVHSRLQSSFEAAPSPRRAAPTGNGASYTGFVNRETTSVLRGQLTITRSPGESVGNYVITPAGLTSPNYAIIFNPGTFTISAPAPVILSLTRTGAADITLNLSAVIGATYRVQYDSDLNGTNWTDLDGDVLASGGTASKTDTFMGTNRYYRIHVIP